ncbi:2-oxoglutarate-dependent dioxygenase AOP2 [Linum perenne]
MASQPITSIPVIDLSPNILEPGTDSWVLTMENVRQAMEQIGCFQVIYDKGPSSEIIHDNIVAAMEELFKLPIEIKSKKLSHKPYFNYFGHHHDYPLIESLAADHPDTLHGCRSFTHAMWPSGNDQFWYEKPGICQGVGGDRPIGDETVVRELRCGGPLLLRGIPRSYKLRSTLLQVQRTQGR